MVMIMAITIGCKVEVPILYAAQKLDKGIFQP
jgi:hypothetical protein